MLTLIVAAEAKRCDSFGLGTLGFVSVRDGPVDTKCVTVTALSSAFLLLVFLASWTLLKRPLERLSNPHLNSLLAIC